ncbi:MAG TPA: POTRA domain-containing protein, partial [Edaphobacter sp.]|nr:POTRA domain-containing protein [Edaphobacter sp.]
MRIFTVNRESGSSLKSKAKPVCTRSSRSRIAHAAYLFAIAVVTASSLPAQTPTAPSSLQGVEVLCQPQVIGNRRIPKESVLARLFSRQNDVYDPLVVERDFNSLWNTGYFEDVQIERVDTPKCVQLIIYVREKPTIREINYTGLNAVTQSDVLDRFKKAKVPLSVESQYDATKIARAVVVLKDLLAEHGHQFATVTPEIKKIPPASVAITFKIKEGPTVKVGKIQFEGNYNLSARTLRGAMKNLKPIGIPHSIILENLFARTFDASKLDEDTERVRQAYRDRGYFKAQTSEPTTHIRDAGGLNPFTLRPSKGKRIDILMPVEEGARYKLAGINFTGNAHVPNVKALRAQFAQKDGEWFNATLFSKGLDQLRKSYGSLGYINMVAQPVPAFDEAKKTITLNIDIDEGKP